MIENEMVTGKMFEEERVESEMTDEEMRQRMIDDLNETLEDIARSTGALK